MFHPEVRADSGFLCVLNKAGAQRGVLCGGPGEAHGSCVLYPANRSALPHTPKKGGFGLPPFFVSQKHPWNTVRNCSDMHFAARMLKSPFPSHG